MRCDVVGMRVTDKYEIRTILRFMRIQPQTLLRQIQTSRLKLDPYRTHQAKYGRSCLSQWTVPAPRWNSWISLGSLDLHRNHVAAAYRARPNASAIAARRFEDFIDADQRLRQFQSHCFQPLLLFVVRVLMRRGWQT